MKVVSLNEKLSNEQKETILRYDYIDKKWYMDTTVAKHANRACKQGWTQTTKYIYNGVVVGGCFEATDRAITIRNSEKKKVSEKQMSNLSNCK
jgi:hypothetical protein